MFQYAAGRALALSKGTSLRLDVSAFANYGLHQGFELHRVFNCPAQIAEAADVAKMLGWQASPLIRKLVAREAFRPLRHPRLIVEPYFSYWPAIRDVPDDCYLMGYWQSEKYFEDCAEQIRHDLKFSLPLTSRNEELAEKLCVGNAVSLHVRRGDYVSNWRANATHGLCSLDYYRDTVQYIAERVMNPHFYIFSDDVEWVRDNLKLEFAHDYVNHNHGQESFNDMRLMSLCKHNIIANSSFSWWGAWLNASADKIVAAPKRWFAKEINSQDLIPPGWVRL